METNRINIIKEYILKLEPILERANVLIGPQKEIQHGVQVLFEDVETCEYLTVNFYKGKSDICTVPNRRDSELYFKIVAAIEFCRGETDSDKEYAGTDESGKGDYFGPLVVAAFATNEQISIKMHETGIRDSKKMDDQTAIEFGEYLEGDFADRIAVTIIEPAKYNELYSHYRFEGKNLNDLLSWGHANAIEDLLSKNNEFDHIIADKFGLSASLKQSLYSKGKKCDLIQNIKAESNIAVAAASVIARMHFLKWLSKATEKTGISIPKGSFDDSVAAAVRIVRKYEKQELRNYVKLHFKNTAKVLKLLNER